MKFTKSFLEEVLVIVLSLFCDYRGWFMKTYSRELHYQLNHKAQTKLVCCTKGEVVFDVAVDLRKESPTYGPWFGGGLKIESSC